MSPILMRPNTSDETNLEDAENSLNAFEEYGAPEGDVGHEKATSSPEE